MITNRAFEITVGQSRRKKSAAFFFFNLADKQDKQVLVEAKVRSLLTLFCSDTSAVQKKVLEGEGSNLHETSSRTSTI